MSDAPAGLNPETAVSIGLILAPVGLRGEIKVRPLTDFPERFEAGALVWLSGVAIEVERSRWQGRTVYLKLHGVDDRNAAEPLRDKELLVPELTPLEEEGVFYQHDITGLTVRDEAGRTLGKVAEILSTGANDVYVVRGELGELLLPAVEDVVKEIDTTGGLMIVDLLPGLEFRSTTSKPEARQTKKPKPSTAP